MIILKDLFGKNSDTSNKCPHCGGPLREKDTWGAEAQMVCRNCGSTVNYWPEGDWHMPLMR